MKFFTLLAAAALALPLIAGAAESAHHEHEAKAPGKIELNAGKKWETDDSLRKGMSAIKGSVAVALPAAHAGKFTPAQYDNFAGDVNRQIAFIVQNCKLDPEADAQLHFIVGDMVDSLDIIQGKQPGKERALGVVKIAQALNTYGRYFDHAGWHAIKLPH